MRATQAFRSVSVPNSSSPASSHARRRGPRPVYACFCTRADIAAALEAPHGVTAHYPGTCRALPDDPERRAATPHCWRIDSVKAWEITGLPSWSEADGRRFTTAPDHFDDAI